MKQKRQMGGRLRERMGGGEREYNKKSRMRGRKIGAEPMRK
jgi:hypothetical protein